MQISGMTLFMRRYLCGFDGGIEVKCVENGAKRPDAPPGRRRYLR